jgi:hypothetical protein
MNLAMEIEMTDWQTMETAPKDGSPVLLYAVTNGWEHNGFSRVAGYWDGYGWALYGCCDGEPKASEIPAYQKVQRLGQCTPARWAELPDDPF